MANPAGRPNITNKVLDDDGKFTLIWYRFMIEMWVRSGGSTDDVTDLRDQINLVGLGSIAESVEKGDLSPSIIIKQMQGDLSPVTQQISQASLADLAPV